MSGFAFSHQFSQRWLATPTSVKNTIIQELDDIVTLLQPQTQLDTFHFHVNDLTETVESLMQEENLRQQIEDARREAERLEQERLAAEKLEAQRLEQIRLEEERQQKALEEQRRIEQEERERAEIEALQQEAKRQEKIRLAKAEEQKRLEQASSQQEAIPQQTQYRESDTQNPPSKYADSDEADNEVTDTKGDSALLNIQHAPTEIVDAIQQNDVNAASVTVQNKVLSASNTEMASTITNTEVKGLNTILSASKEANQEHEKLIATPNIEAIKHQIIEQLQVHIERYMQESMVFIQDDLNKWLKDEVERQLNQHFHQHN